MAIHERSVWSAHRESSSVKTFKSILTLRHADWVWADDPADASIWLLDGTFPLDEAVIADLRSVQVTRNNKAALLSRQFMTLPGLECVFFKTPLSPSTVDAWIVQQTGTENGAESGASLRYSQFQGKWLRLSGWPNVSRYTDKKAIQNSLLLTLACTEMLTGWRQYEALFNQVDGLLSFNQMLDDALVEGLLEVSSWAPKRVNDHSTTPILESESIAIRLRKNTNSPLSFLKRLFAKFS
jgi:hypothetical protein